MATPDNTGHQSTEATPGLEKRQAVEHIQRNELAKADSILGRICRDNPGDHEAWLLRGITLQLGGQQDAAIASFYRALALRPDYTKAHQYLTSSLLSSSRFHELIDSARNALACLPQDAELHCKLAIGLERTHQLEEARQAAEAALQLAPGHTRVMLTLAKIDKQTGHLDKARERLETLQNAQLAPVQLCAVLGELGDVLDRLSEYNSAYHAFHSSNQAMLKMAKPEQRPSTTIFDAITHYHKTFPNLLAHARPESGLDDATPSPVFLVGFPRSGTTLTEQIITAGGSIVPTDEETVIYRLIKEIPGVLKRAFVYPDDLASLASTELSALRRHYWKLVAEMVNAEIGDNRLLDKLPLNLIEIGFISLLFPASPIVIVLRDPRDCCLSCFMRAFAPNQAMINFSTIEDTARFYSAVMDYWIHIRTSLKSNYLEVHYEDLVTDLEGTTRSLIAHIGGEWNDSVLRFFEHSNKRKGYDGVVFTRSDATKR